ncbi:MAG: hypothetical protein Q8L36_00575 [bacterium]|nr:hypothetical protein [bacterium]
MCCSFHEDRLLQQYPEVTEGVRNGNGPVITGTTMDRSGSWRLLPGESQIPALSEVEALRLFGSNSDTI